MSQTCQGPLQAPKSTNISDKQGVPKEAAPSPGPTGCQDELLILLDGIRDHIVVANEGDTKHLRAQLDDINKRFRNAANRRELVVETLRVLDAYAARTNHVLARQRLEMTRFAGDLSGLMNTLVTSQPVSKAIRTLGREMERAAESGELLDSKAAILREALAAVRNELLTTRKRLGNLVSSTIARIRALEWDKAGAEPESSRANCQPDGVTGLPSRSHAEAELAKIHAWAEDRLLALFAVKRLDLINAKFGYLRGDQVLLSIVQHLVQAIPDSDHLFRWTPCSFLIVMSQASSRDELHKRVQMISENRITMTLEWEGRSALVPVVVEGHIHSLRASASLDCLCSTLDKLASDSKGRAID